MIQKSLKQLELIGEVNLLAEDEFDRLLLRDKALSNQKKELEIALKSLGGAIDRIEKEAESLFQKCFTQLNTAFSEVFPDMFGGGKGQLSLIENNLYQGGVVVSACPPGKRPARISQLSGGEKALCALALILSFFRLNPAPFCLLDEVDAPLDDINASRFAEALGKMSQKVQFVCVTHNKLSMQKADYLLGVTMQEPGVSQLVKIDIKRALAMTEH